MHTRFTLRHGVFMLFIVSVGVLIPPAVSAESVIIARDRELLTLFRDSDPEEIEAFARDIGLRYDGAVLHLGRGYVFRRGGPFFYRTSRKNLQIFCSSMKASGKNVYLWFLDSFGSEDFHRIYEDHERIIDENLRTVRELELAYDGIVVDLEWINLPSGDNAGSYLSVLRYLRHSLGEKKLLVFASLIDNPGENLRRGYDEEKILQIADNVIPMLYPVDGGFKMTADRPVPLLNDARIASLRRYYWKSGYKAAVSLEGAIILERGGTLEIVRTAGDPEAEFSLRKTDSHAGLYFQIDSFRARDPFELTRNDGTRVLVRENENLHHFRVLETILCPGDYLWEYFLIRDYALPPFSDRTTTNMPCIRIDENTISEIGDAADPPR